VNQLRVDLTTQRTNLVNKNKHGSIMKLELYKSSREVWVRFPEYGNIVKTNWKNFFEGTVKNPYNRTVFGIGYLGEGKYKGCINKNKTPEYKSWHRMMCRCYDKKLHIRQPKYRDCEVSEEWHNFQNFAKWYDENYYEINGETMCLDKDILVKGNKIYSPETCVFVPKRINLLFVKNDAIRGELPIGVNYDKNNKNYVSHCKINTGKTIHIGCYSTKEEAFRAYKLYKEQIIKQVAEQYKNKIPEKLYNVMINYEVEIND
jgi:hypothetical protein